MINTEAIRQNQAMVAKELEIAQQQLNELKLQLAATRKEIKDYYNKKAF